MGSVDGNGSRTLFEGVVVALILSDQLEEEETDQITEIVANNGGKVVQVCDNSNGVENLSNATHIIATNIDFPQYNKAVERGVLVVKPSWVRQSQAKSKLVGARQHSPDPNQYFQQVVLTCGDLPEGDKDAIIAGVMALGGQYSGALNKLTTHIVTLDYDHPKSQLAVRTKAKCISVLPHWFDDCLRLGKKISERPYVFPNPIHLQATLPRPFNSDSGFVEGASSCTPLTSALSPPTSPSKVRRNLNAFMSKKIMLSSDLGLSAHLTGTLKQLVNQGGGLLTDNISTADIYICQYRDGPDYMTASRARKEVANLSWLYHVIHNNKYTNPLSRLLHYPIPRNGLPGFSNLKISISNYNGEARTYLENLIRYCGAEFTKTMKQDNTHLIAAHTKSEKFEAAQEWNLHITNHLWLEESYAKGCVQTLSNPRYTHFPASTNLSEVCGQSTIDLKSVERMFFPAPRVSPQKTMRSPDPHAKGSRSPQKELTSSRVTAMGIPQKTAAASPPTPIQEDEETEDEDDDEQEEVAAKLKRKPAALTADVAAPVDDLDEGEQADISVTARPRGRPRKSAATPRCLDEEKENESPFVTTSARADRAAKSKANANIHNLAPDILAFEKELKRKGGVTHGGRRSDHPEDFSSPVPAQPKNMKKRKSDEGTYDVSAQGSDLSDGETQAVQAKKAKTTSEVPPIMYRMMVTGDERWVGKTKQEDADRLKLRMLGVELTQDPLQVDILVAPAIKRTKKFVAALANAPLVVDTKYLDAALKQEKLTENPILLQDRKTENAMDFKLSEAIDRAKVNAHKLLEGWSIFVAKEIAGGWETYKDIITVNGGETHMYAGRTGLQLPKRAADDAGEEHDYAYLVSGASEAEVKLWKTFRSTAEKQNLRTRIVKSDWLLTMAITQEFRWKAEFEWEDR
ncbi:hypothetical protein LTR62_008163 [Meristemomyces frigidus]|uniref:BRCT domain-containing protein n=1 Tax=Meristemomyces frigidus TaxID=1508187 RepID=A0AAN7TA14_9PEZI|nr:hypothetical protein LTR62_008163 [Meristemomyces frigidus]